MGKLRKARSASSNKAAVAPVPAPASPKPPSVAPSTSSPISLRSSAPPTTSTTRTDGVASSFTSLGLSNRPPSGVGSRSIRSASSASLDMTKSLSHSHSPTPPASSSPPTPTSLHAAAASSTGSTSALSLLRNRLETDDAHRTRIVSEASSTSTTSTVVAEPSKKLRKRRPQLGGVFTPDGASGGSGATAVDDGDGDDERDGDAPEEDDDADSVASVAVVEFEPERFVPNVEEASVRELEQEIQASVRAWATSGFAVLGWAVGIPKRLVAILPIVGPLIVPRVERVDPDSLGATPEYWEEETHSGGAWGAVEVTLGVGIAAVLLASTGVELLWASLGRRTDKGKTRAVSLD